MKRLSDFKGEAAIDALADIMIPLSIILADPSLKESMKGKTIAQMVQPMIKNHPNELIQILARLNEQSEEEYKKNVSLLSLPKDVLTLVNDPEIQSLFPSQRQIAKNSDASSGSAMENIEAKGK
jgi:hypothetical protein